MTTPSSKPEYPPLLSVGFHEMTVEQIRDICVTNFPLSKKRKGIMDNLEHIISCLSLVGIVADVWVDGSFMTEKIEPEDSDIVVCIENGVYDNGTLQQRDTIEWINSNLRADLLCDSYVHVEYPIGHPSHSEGEWLRAYWIKQFGFSRGEEFKGMALVKVS
jgi:hypothetical protein